MVPRSPARKASLRSGAIAQRLRDGTGDLHASIERNARFCRLLAADLGREEYTTLLARLFGFHVSYEAALLSASTWLPAGVGLARRLGRRELLHRDLLALGRSDAEIAALPLVSAPVMQVPEAAWGALYVIEGASLGGQIIARHLSAAKGMGPESGAGYHTPYGPETGQMWLGFKIALEAEHGAGRLDGDATVAWARRTFIALDEWVAG